MLGRAQFMKNLQQVIKFFVLFHARLMTIFILLIPFWMGRSFQLFSCQILKLVQQMHRLLLMDLIIQFMDLLRMI
jgi:hypothetical protein